MYNTKSYQRILKARKLGVECSGEYSLATTPTSHTCTRCSYTWDAKPVLILGKHVKCPNCKNIRRVERLNKKYAKARMNIECIEPYVKGQRSFLHRCTKCLTVWSVRPSSILYGRSHCISCHTPFNRTPEFLKKEYLKKLRKRHPKIECIGEYTHSLVRVLHKCHTCEHEWEPYPNNLIQGHGCPNCAPNRVAFKDH